MKVMYVGENGCLPLTNGKTYEVIGELTILSQYLIRDDFGHTSYYDKEEFKEVKEMEIENVLELEYQEVFDKVAVRIVYQNEEILKRDKFEDREIGVESLGSPDFCYESLYIRGRRKENDSYCCLISKEKAEEIKEKVRKINERYGIRKRWRAKKGNYYYYVDSFGKICNTKEVYIDIDDDRYEIGNYFKTKKSAEEVAKKVRQVFKEA